MNVYRDRSDEEDDWDGDDRDDTDDEPTVPCPYCKEEILDDSPYCPHCERYISEEDHAGPSKPLWVILTALVCLAAAVWVLVAAR